MKFAKPFLRVLPKHLTCLSAICLAFLSAASARAQTPWLNEAFVGYTNGQALTNSLSPQLITQSGSPSLYTTITNQGGNTARYRKLTNSVGSYPAFAFSPTNSMTARSSGYVTFRIKQNVEPSISNANSFFVGIGNTNLGTSVSSSANRLISVSFAQSGTPANTLSVNSAATEVVRSFSYNNSTSFGRVQIWFNDSDVSALSYTNPSGVATNLQTNAFVVFLDGVLVTATNSGNAPLTGAGGTNLNIGKIGFGTSSSSSIDYSFADIYVADSAPGVTNAPAITSATNAAASLNIPFSYQITTDPPGATSYALIGTLPSGLNFNSTKGLISGIPTALEGPTTVVLTASNSVGTGAPVNLAITVSLPVNVFSGSKPSLDTSASWSLSSPPTGSTNVGSYTDLVFSATETNLTTPTGFIRGKSWNATNGLSYNFSSVSSSNQTIFRIANTGNPDTYPYSNAVAGADNVMLFLTNGSKLTFSPANTAPGGTNSIVQVRNSGIMLIAAGSVADFQAAVTNSAMTNVLSKSGNGTLVFGARSYNFSGTTALEAGTLRFSDTGSGTNTAGTFTLAGGTVEAMADYDLGHAYGTLTNNGTNTWEKLDGQTTTISGPVTLNAAPGVTLALYRLAGTTNSANVMTKTGSGTLQLRGGGAPSIIADWLLNDGTLFVNTTASGGLGTNNSVIMNGGNILFTKGVSSTGTYTGQGQDVGLQVRQNGTITLNANTNTAPSNNTVSFTNLVISNQTLTVVKGAEAYCSTNPGYTDPLITFLAATLNGSATFAVGTNVQTVLRAGAGSGGVTKSDAGKLTISSASVVTNSVTNSVPNTYTGPTTVNAGTLQLGGSHASSITVASNAILESALVSTNWPTTTGSLTFSAGAKVRITETPTLDSYTLVTASQGITGTPTLESAIVGYALATSGNSLILTTAVPTTPTIAVTGSFTNFSTTIGAPSAAQTVSASGSDLTTSITVTPPAGYEVSTDGISYNASLSLTPSGGVVASTIVYVRLTGAAVGSFSGNVSFASTGASTQSVPVIGSVVSLYDSWASGYGLSGTNAATTADPDLDGFNNNSEYFFDGNPTSSTPYLFQVTPSSTNAVFNWIQRNSGVSYEVQTNSTLTNVWTGPAAVTISNSANQSGVLLTNDYMRKEFIVPASGKSFYRVKATIAP